MLGFEVQFFEKETPFLRFIPTDYRKQCSEYLSHSFRGKLIWTLGLVITVYSVSHRSNPLMAVVMVVCCLMSLADMCVAVLCAYKSSLYSTIFRMDCLAVLVSCLCCFALLFTESKVLSLGATCILVHVAVHSPSVARCVFFCLLLSSCLVSYFVLRFCSTLAEVVPVLLYTGGLLVCTLYVFTVLGLVFLSRLTEFRSFSTALLTTFEMCLGGWGSYMQHALAHYGALISIFFILFFAFCVLIVFNLGQALVLSYYETTSDKEMAYAETETLSISVFLKPKNWRKTLVEAELRKLSNGEVKQLQKIDKRSREELQQQHKVMTARLRKVIRLRILWLFFTFFFNL